MCTQKNQLKIDNQFKYNIYCLIYKSIKLVYKYDEKQKKKNNAITKKRENIIKGLNIQNEKMT